MEATPKSLYTVVYVNWNHQLIVTSQINVILLIHNVLNADRGDYNGIPVSRNSVEIQLMSFNAL